MVTTIVRLRGRVSRRGTSVTPPTISSRHDTGLARSYGLARVEVLRAVPKEEGESINLGAMKQGYNSRLDESLGARHGKKSQSMKARRDESKGASKAAGKNAYAGDHSMEETRRINNVKAHLSNCIRK
tara:strand:+ start:943 stop:1326 length:384 start_codon:yes stop_codon:yes gene_type:complete